MAKSESRRRERRSLGRESERVKEAARHKQFSRVPSTLEAAKDEMRNAGAAWSQFEERQTRLHSASGPSECSIYASNTSGEGEFVKVCGIMRTSEGKTGKAQHSEC